VRPSSLLRLQDPYSSWCLDECAYVFGKHIESELQMVERGKKESDASFRAKLERRMDQLLGQESEESDNRRFASPVATR
jgi:hypothetical protein